MNGYDFWKNWKNKTPVENRAIESVLKARDLVIRSIPSAALVGIYIKGSFARREMKENSDVDMVPIVTEDKYEGAIFEVNVPEIAPVCVVPLSLTEFRNNKLSSKGNYDPDLRAEPDLFLLKLEESKLIYGNVLNPSDYPTRTKNKIVLDEVNKIKNGYIPAYREGIITLEPLLKEVFWLIGWEQDIGRKLKIHSFKEIINSIKDKNHIIYEVMEFRKNPNKDKFEEINFIKKLEKYLDSLIV